MKENRGMGMGMGKNNITSINKPRCSRCGAFKKIEELNDYDPLAPVGQKYKNAFCKRLAECDSPQAGEKLSRVANIVKDETE